MTIQLKQIAEWFTTIKAPDLKDKINEGLKTIESGELLQGNHKKLFGFMLFSYSMNHGPCSFLVAEQVAKEISVSEEVKFYAKDWIDYKPNPQP